MSERVPNHGHFEAASVGADELRAVVDTGGKAYEAYIAMVQVHATLAVVEAIDRLTAAITDTDLAIGTVD